MLKVSWHKGRILEPAEKLKGRSRSRSPRPRQAEKPSISRDGLNMTGLEQGIGIAIAAEVAAGVPIIAGNVRGPDMMMMKRLEVRLLSVAAAACERKKQMLVDYMAPLHTNCNTTIVLLPQEEF
ncbi:hypothetical protein Tco_0835000 [Tanacetum coccineum]